MCDAIPVVATRTHVVIVRHFTEKTRSSNSGRLANFALPNSEIVEHGGFEGLAKLPPMEGAWLVYPEGEPMTVLPTDRPAPKQLVFLDATWSQARRMFRKLAGLRGLPILRLPEGETVARMREAPTPDRVSTLEAVARALRLVEGDAVADPLETLYALAVERATEAGRRLIVK